MFENHDKYDVDEIINNENDHKRGDKICPLEKFASLAVVCTNGENG